MIGCFLSRAKTNHHITSHKNPLRVVYPGVKTKISAPPDVAAKNRDVTEKVKTRCADTAKDLGM